MPPTLLAACKRAAYRSYRRAAIATGWLTTGRRLPQSLQRGHCPICERPSLFVRTAEWLRDHYHCARCLSIPRQRALVAVLHERFPSWRTLAIHESSPSGPASEKLEREAARYLPSHYFPDAPRGSIVRGFRCEDLQQLSFADATFDLVITQDVLEHVLAPARAFAEIARTLRPGGAHVFTVPLYDRAATVRRAHLDGDRIVHDLPPDYHHNPVDDEGSLVANEWGRDLPDFVFAASGLDTEIVRLERPHAGIAGEFIEVMISRKPNG